DAIEDGENDGSRSELHPYPKRAHMIRRALLALSLSAFHGVGLAQTPQVEPPPVEIETPLVHPREDRDASDAIADDRDGKGELERSEGEETTARDLAPTAGEEGEATSQGELPTLFIRGRGESLLEIAASASEGRVGQAEIATRPWLRPGEVLEVIPGMMV